MRTPLITPDTPCGFSPATFDLQCNCTNPLCPIREEQQREENTAEEPNPLYAQIPEDDDRKLIDWEEVEDSMEERPEEVSATPDGRWTVKTCPYCRSSAPLRSLYFKNDSYLWTLGCGRGGFLLVCLDCKFPLQFDLEEMS
jgi:hypothetical protein